MEYTKKHQNLIAKFFKKVGMPKEADTVLSCKTVHKHAKGALMGRKGH